MKKASKPAFPPVVDIAPAFPPVVDIALPDGWVERIWGDVPLYVCERCDHDTTDRRDMTERVAACQTCRGARAVASGLVLVANKRGEEVKE